MRKWAYVTAPLVVAWFVGAVTAPVPTGKSRSPLTAPFLALAIVFLVATIVLVVVARRQTRQEMPRILFHDPSTNMRAIYQTASTAASAIYQPSSPPVVVVATTHFEPGETWAFFTYLWVENKPLRGSAEAKDVRVEICFRSLDGDVIHKMDGRWSEVLQPVPSEHLLAPRHRNLPANGRLTPIDVVLRYPGEDQCFAFNDRTGYEALDLRAHGLGTSPVIVEIELTGSNVSAKATYTLTPKGAKGSPEMVRRS